MARVTFGDENSFASIVGYKGVLAVAFPLEFSGQDDAVVVQFEMSVVHHLNEGVFRHFMKNVHTKHFQRMGREVQSTEYLFDSKVLTGTHLHPGYQLFSQFALSHVLAGFLFLLLRHGGCRLMFF